jgi:outer membrane protein assembly factor BamB
VRARWKYEVPDRGDDAPNDANAPLYWDGQAVLLPISRYKHDRETRAKDPRARGSVVDVHCVGLDGKATRLELFPSTTIIAQSWSFLPIGERLLLHLGDFHSLPDGRRLVNAPGVNASHGAGRGIFFQRDERLYFVGGNQLRCYDVASDTCSWTLDLKSNRSYQAGPLALQQESLICYGRDALNFIDLASGEVEKQLTLPRIDKLYPPREHEGDLLLAYTNWTTGGLLRLDPATNQIKWRFRSKGRVAVPRGGELPVVGGIAVVSVNDGSSLVGVDLDTGDARWTYRSQWLYTPIEVVGGSLIFGTAGGYGRHLRRHRADSGETEWAVQFDGGCPYYSRQGEHLIAGDWGGAVRRVHETDGRVVDELRLRAPIQTAPLVVGSDVFVLTWPTDGSAPALVAVDTAS